MGNSTNPIHAPTGILEYEIHQTENETLWEEYLAHGKNFCAMESRFTDQFQQHWQCYFENWKPIAAGVIAYFILGFSVFCYLASGKMAPMIQSLGDRDLSRCKLLGLFLLYFFAGVLWPLVLLLVAATTLYSIFTEMFVSDHEQPKHPFVQLQSVASG